MAARGVIAIVAFVLTALPAASEGVESRFQMLQAGEDVLRIDTLTGAIDTCGAQGDGWSCRRVVAPPDGGRDVEAAQLREALAERDRLKSALGEIAKIAAEAIGEPHPPVAMSDEARRSIDEALDVTDYTLRRALTIYRALLEPELGVGATQ